MAEYLRVFRHVGFFRGVNMDGVQPFANFADNPSSISAEALGALVCEIGEQIVCLAPVPLPARRELILALLGSLAGLVEEQQGDELMADYHARRGSAPKPAENARVDLG